MAIYGIGAYYDQDVSPMFIQNGLAGTGWTFADAPEIHRFIIALKVGDIVYIKASSPRSADIIVRGIGFVRDNQLIDSTASAGLVEIGRRVDWRVTQEFRIPKPQERNNVRSNTIYEEFHPDVQAAIMAKL